MQRTGVKLKFAISDSSLDKDIDELRNLNDAFRKLANQADRLVMIQQKAVVPTTLNTRKPSQAFKVHSAIQKTSRILYQTLSEACNKHTEHETYLCLQPLIKPQSTVEIRFDISYDHIPPYNI